MSVYVWSLVTGSSVRFPQRYTLLALADYANDSGVCWPAVSSLADWGQITESTVRRHLRPLIADGIVSATYRDDQSSVYKINLTLLRALKRPPRSDSRQSDSGVRSGRGKERPPVETDSDPRQSDSGVQIDSGAQIAPAPPGDLNVDPPQSEPLTVSEPSGEPPLFVLDPVEPETPATPDPERGFEDFWTVWPRRVAKAEARRCYGRAVKRGASPDHLIAAARRQVKRWEAENRQVKHIPHATTWLNQERYDDEPERPDLRLVPDGPSPWAGQQPTGTESPWAQDMGWR